MGREAARRICAVELNRWIASTALWVGKAQVASAEGQNERSVIVGTGRAMASMSKIQVARDAGNYGRAVSENQFSSN